MTLANLTETWKQIYTLGEELFRLEPWKVLNETDLFGVQSPDTGKEYYISMIGSDGVAFGIMAYQGTDAILRFLNIQAYDEPPQPGEILAMPYLMLLLTEPENIDEFQLLMIEQYGLFNNCSGKMLPHLTHNIPGLLPATPEKESITDFIHILRESINVITRAIISKVFIHPETDHDDDYLFRKAETIKGIQIWKDVKHRLVLPENKIKISYHPSVLKEFLRLPVYNGMLQMDLVMLPSPVKEGSLPPYFPSMLLLADSKTGIILFQELFQPFPDYQGMVDTIPEVFMKKCIEYGKRPSRIKFRSLDLQGTCLFLEQKASVKAWHSIKLGAIDDALENMKEFFGS